MGWVIQTLMPKNNLSTVSLSLELSATWVVSDNRYSVDIRPTWISECWRPYRDEQHLPYQTLHPWWRQFSKVDGGDCSINDFLGTLIWEAITCKLQPDRLWFHYTLTYRQLPVPHNWGQCSTDPSGPDTREFKLYEKLYLHVVAVLWQFIWKSESLCFTRGST